MFSQTRLEFGPFVLTPSERLLLKGGKPVRLTPKIFDLLVLLAGSPGRLLTKDELMEALWPGTAVEESNLSQSVFTLRKALGEGEYVETVPKRGYRFVAPVRGASQGGGRCFRQLTFRRGSLHAARFENGADAFVYGAAWDGGPTEVYSGNAGSPESRPLGAAGAGLLAVSSTGELAVSLRRRFLRGYVHVGTLARVASAGGAAREVLDDVQWADFAPDGRKLLVVRDVCGRNRLEYPVGHVVYETGGWVSHPRVSRDGGSVAFIDHPVPADDRGEVAVVGANGEKRSLAGGWVSVQGLAWSPSGREVWFTATKTGNARALYAAALDGGVRLLEQVAGSVTLHDVAHDGRALVTRDTTRLGIVCLAPGGGRERELSWFDWSLARDLSADGTTLLFTEAGEAGGAAYGVYLRGTDGSPAVRLGDGSALALSPDGKWALANVTSEQTQLVLLPTGAGEPRLLEHGGLRHQPWGCFSPDGERVLFAAAEPGRGTRLYAQDVNGGPPTTITPDVEGVELTTPHAVSPDGEWVAAVGPDQYVSIFPVEGGRSRRLEGTIAGDMPVRWSGDGAALYVRQRGAVPVSVYRLELSTGRRELVRELMPPDPTGVYEVLRVLLTPDASCHAYTYTRDLSDLYLVEGLR